jgi:hypothetical protein
MVIGLSIAVLSPKVQTYVAHKAAHYLSEKTGADVRVGSLAIRPFRTVRLKDVYFSDLQKDTLFAIGHLDARLSNFDIFNPALHFDKVELFDVHARMYRNIDSDTFNFHFLNKLFTSDKPKKKKTGNPLVFSVKVIDTRNINFSWDDQKTGQFYYGRFDRLLIDAEEADLKKKTFTLNSILLEKPDVRLRIYNQNKKEKEKKDVSLDLGFRIKFREFNLTDGFFAIKTKQDPKPTRLPLNVFDFAVKDIQVQIKDGRWDSIALADIRMISARIGDDIVLKELSGKGSADSTHTAMQDMVIRYNESVIAMDTRLEYSALNDYRDFMSAVFWQGKVKEIDVKKNDIAMWMPAEAKKYVVDVKMKGDIQGTFSNIRLENMEIKTGSQTVIAGKASVKGMPNIDQMLLDVQLDRMSTSIAELKRLMPYVKLPSQLDKLGNVSFKGAYFGFVNDFVAYGKLKTAVGDVSSDIKISIDKKTKTPYYSGTFAGYNVDPGAFMKGNKLLGKANFDLKLDGKGFNIDQLASNVTGTISSLEFKGYTYQDIHLEGRVDKKLFTGTVNIDDPCLFFNFDGTVDFNNPSPVYKAQTKIRHADLQGLNLTKENLVISMEGYIDVQGKNLNDLNGQIDLTGISLENEKSSFELSETRISLTADSLSGYKEYIIASEEISAWVKGNFDPVAVGPQFMKYLGGYSVWLPQKNDLELKKQSFTAHFEMDSDFGIVSFFEPKFERFHNLYLDASFDNTTDDFSVFVNADSVFYDEMGAYNFSIDGGMSGKSIVLFALTDSLTIGKKIKQTIPLIQAGISSSYDSLMVDLGVEHDTAINSIRLQTIIDRFGDSTTFKVLSSRLRVNNKDWTIAPDNSLLLHDSIFIAKNFILLQGDQSIRILNARTSLSDARIEFDNFSLGDVGQLLPNDSILQAGRLFGSVTILNPLKNLQADADLRFTGLNVFGFEGGDVNVVARYVDSSKVVTAKGKIDGEDFKLSFDGNYDINGDNLNSTNIDANIERASLGFLELLLKKEISNTSAFVKGKVNFSGSPKQPMLSGVATVIDTARTTVNFLGANFRFANEEIIIRPTEFDFGTITLWDPDGNTAIVSGLLKHQYFKDFELDLNINTNKFQLMNTTAKDNQDYYGTAYAKADVAMFGPVNNLNIDIQAKTLPNTIFSIPLAKLSNTETYKFIQFRSRGDTTTSIEEPYRSVLKGVNLNFDLEVTRDALLRIIFNPATNDMITARGHGDLEIDIASAGDFNIFGTLAVDEGQYLFTFQNIINKRFEIKPGGSISWTGDPQNALLNIDALYKTKVRIDNALGDSSSVSSRSIPIDLEMKLTGDLSNTEINFNIVPTGLDFSSQSDEVNALLNQLREDKNLMNTQVFGILLFNRFLPSGTNTVASGSLGAEFAGNTVTELLSTQLSMYLNDAISQFTKNLELDFNFRTGNFNNTQDRDAVGVVSELDLGLKTKLFNDRIILNVGGTFDFGRTDPAQQSNTGIAGDFVVEYLLSADGRIRLKAFHRTSEYDIFGEQRSKTGASIFYRKDFDRLRELFQREKRRLKKEGKKPS